MLQILDKKQIDFCLEMCFERVNVKAINWTSYTGHNDLDLDQMKGSDVITIGLNDISFFSARKMRDKNGCYHSTWERIE